VLFVSNLEMSVHETSAAPKSAFAPITGIYSVVRCRAQPTRVEVPLAKRRSTTEPPSNGPFASPLPRWGWRELTSPGPKRPITWGVPALLTCCDASSAVGSSIETSDMSAGDHSLRHSFVAQRLSSDRVPIVLAPYTVALSGQLFPPLGDGLAALSQCPLTVRSMGYTLIKEVVPVPGSSVVIRAVRSTFTQPSWGLVGRKPERVILLPTHRDGVLLRTRGKVPRMWVFGGESRSGVLPRWKDESPPKSWRALTLAGENTNMVAPLTANACLRHELLGRGAKPHMPSSLAGHTIGSTQTVDSRPAVLMALTRRKTRKETRTN